MQKEQQIEREIHEVEHKPLSAEARAKLERVKALTGLSDAEARALALSRGVGASFALASLVPRQLH